jgi:hypothetical protein
MIPALTAAALLVTGLAVIAALKVADRRACRFAEVTHLPTEQEEAA